MWGVIEVDLVRFHFFPRHPGGAGGLSLFHSSVACGQGCPRGLRARQWYSDLVNQVGGSQILEKALLRIRVVV